MHTNLLSLHYLRAPLLLSFQVRQVAGAASDNSRGGRWRIWNVIERDLSDCLDDVATLLVLSKILLIH